MEACVTIFSAENRCVVAWTITTKQPITRELSGNLGQINHEGGGVWYEVPTR